ncbi:MAG: ComEA family DNA-binding protein [SAR202 cluster bacterium]|nr:ComEA family DNA-binding protein [SAR202 cluster bacterium]
MAEHEENPHPPTPPGRDWRGVAQLGLFLLFLLALGGGIALLVRQSARSGLEITLPPSDVGTVTVHITGAVARPGVYVLPEGSRLHAAIDAAGGLTVEADAARVNLAVRLRDGEQYGVLRVGEAAAQVTQTVGAPLNLNTASTEQLATLPGIGQVGAQAIVTHREERGFFRRHEDLLEVPLIGPATLERLRPMTTVD